MERGLDGTSMRTAVSSTSTPTASGCCSSTASWSPAVSGALLEVRDPSIDEVIAHVPSGGAEDIDLAVEAAARAFPAWRDAGASARADAIREFADAIEQAGEELAWLDTVDNGSPIAVMRGDYRIAVEQLRYFAGLALEIRGENDPDRRA